MDPINREFYENFGGLIRRRRRALDLTQEKLAGRLNISRGTLANIETGRQNILLHQIFRIATALEMDAHELLPTPPSAIEHPASTALPLPKGLTPEQEVQVKRMYSPTPNGNRRGENGNSR